MKFTRKKPTKPGRYTWRLPESEKPGTYDLEVTLHKTAGSNDLQVSEHGHLLFSLCEVKGGTWAQGWSEDQTVSSHHLVLPNELNHHGTLFGGVAMALADKVAYIQATIAHPHANFVTKAAKEFNFLAPAKAGDILEIHAEIKKTGTSSIHIKIQCENALTKQNIFENIITMVHIDPTTQRSAPIPKGEV
jgi:acyl-CoA hydrolase